MRRTQLFFWNVARGVALREWLAGTDAREEAREDAAAALAAAQRAGGGSVQTQPPSRCCDEETAIAALPLSPGRECADDASPRPPWAHNGALDAASLLAAADGASDDSAAPLSPRAAGAALAELCVAHPLLHTGAGLLLFAAQAACATAGLLAASLLAPTGSHAASLRGFRGSSLALQALTLAAGGAVLREEYRRCAAPPALAPALRAAALAGTLALLYALVFTAGVPGAEGADLAVTICTAAASLLVRCAFPLFCVLLSLFRYRASAC